MRYNKHPGKDGVMKFLISSHHPICPTWFRYTPEAYSLPVSSTVLYADRILSLQHHLQHAAALCLWQDYSGRGSLIVLVVIPYSLGLTSVLAVKLHPALWVLRTHMCRTQYTRSKLKRRSAQKEEEEIQGDRKKNHVNIYTQVNCHNASKRTIPSPSHTVLKVLNLTTWPCNQHKLLTPLPSTPFTVRLKAEKWAATLWGQTRLLAFLVFHQRISLPKLCSEAINAKVLYGGHVQVRLSRHFWREPETSRLKL